MKKKKKNGKNNDLCMILQVFQKYFHIFQHKSILFSQKHHDVVKYIYVHIKNHVILYLHDAHFMLCFCKANIGKKHE